MATYLAASINNSPTISRKAGADITDVRFKAVKFDSNGNVVLASASTDVVLGIAIPTTGDADGKVKTGEDIDIQIKEMGMAMAGSAIAVGAAVASDANGKVATAAAGDFIIGYALEAAAAANDIITIQIAKGYYPTAVSAGT